MAVASRAFQGSFGARTPSSPRASPRHSISRGSPQKWLLHRRSSLLGSHRCSSLLPRRSSLLRRLGSCNLRCLRLTRATQVPTQSANSYFLPCPRTRARKTKRVGGRRRSQYLDRLRSYPLGSMRPHMQGAHVASADAIADDMLRAMGGGGEGGGGAKRRKLSAPRCRPAAAVLRRPAAAAPPAISLDNPLQSRQSCR